MLRTNKLKHATEKKCFLPQNLLNYEVKSQKSEVNDKYGFTGTIFQKN